MHSHVCLECGTDLARIRAHREPWYGLWIVACPGCGRVHPRARHPLRRIWPKLRRFDWAMTILVGNLLCAGLLAFLATVWCAGAALLPERLGDPDDVREAIPAILSGFVLLPLAIGTWITWGLGHWRRPLAAWLAFAGTVAVGLALLGTGVIVLNALADIRGGGGRPGMVFDPIMEHGVRWWGLALASLVLVMLIATAGILPGQGLRLVTSIIRRHTWRWRRRRRRRSFG